LTSDYNVTIFVTIKGEELNTSSKFVVSVHILTLLAGRKIIFGDKNGLNSEYIAKSVGTNPVVIRRLIGQLRTEGLVATKQGPNGGSYLVPDPSTIKLSTIYNIVEDGNLYHMHYSSPNQVCPVGSHIQEDLACLLNRAEESFKLVLETKSLLDMVNGIMEKAEHLKGMTREEMAQQWEDNLKSMDNVELESVTT